MELTATGLALCAALAVGDCNVDTVIAAWQKPTPHQFVRVCDSVAGCPMVPSHTRTECYSFPIAEQKYTSAASGQATRYWFSCQFN